MRTRSASLIERGVVYGVVVVLLLANVLFLMLLIKKRGKIARKEKDFQLRAEQMEEEKKKELETVKSFLPEWEVRLAQQQRVNEKFKKMWRHQIERIKEFMAIIPTIEKTPDLINKIANYARELDVKITHLSTEPFKPGPEPGVKEYHFHLNIEGNYHDIKRMLWEIEHMKYIVQMADEGFTIVNLNNDSNNMELHLKLFTYFFSET